LKYKLNSQMWPTGTVATDAMAYVCDDPDTLFQIQGSASVAQTELGSNFPVVQTAGDVASGSGRISLNAAGSATTSTIGLRLVDFVDGPFSKVGDSFTDCIVKFNFGQHSYNSATGV